MSDCDCDLTEVHEEIDILKDVVSVLLEESIEAGLGRVKLLVIPASSEEFGGRHSIALASEFKKIFNKIETYGGFLRQRWPEAEDYFKRLYVLDQKLFLKVFVNSDLRWSFRAETSSFFKSIGAV